MLQSGDQPLKDPDSEKLLTKWDSSSSFELEGPRTLALELDLEENGLPQDKKEIQGESVRGWRWVLYVTALASAMFFYCIDKSVTTIIIPIMVSELGEASKLPWVFVGFGLGALSLILPVGQLYSLYNAKHLYLGFLTTFILGSTLCGAAWSMNTLIIGRVLAGAGGTGVYTGIMTILTATIDVKERPVYLGAIGLFWSIGRILGPLIGGALGKTAWRWGFYINLIVCALFTPVYIYLLPNIHPFPGVPPLVRLRKLDALGWILSISAIVSLFTGVNFGGTRFLWNSATSITIFITAGASLVLLAFQQGLCIFTSPKDRLFPVKMLFIPEACLIFVISASSSIAGFVPTNFVSLYFQFSRGDSALMAALRLLPMIFAMSLGLSLSGYQMPRIGYLEFWPIVGSLVALPGMILMVLLKLTTNPLTIYISQALIGAGMGTYIQIGYTLILPYTPEFETQGALAFIIISQTGAIAFSLSVSSSLFTNIAIQGLTKLLPNSSKEEIERALSGQSGMFFDIVPAHIRDTALGVLVSAMRPAWIISCIALLAGLLASVGLVVLLLYRKKIN